MTRMAIYNQVLRDNPWVDQQEALDYVFGDKNDTRKLLVTQEEHDQIVQQMQQQQQNSQRSMSPAEQAQAGFNNGQ